MGLKSFAAAAFGAAAVAFAAPALADTVIISETTEVHPFGYPYALPGAGTYDVHISSDTPLGLDALARWSYRREVRGTAGSIWDGVLIFLDLEEKSLYFSSDAPVTDFTFSFEIPTSYSYYLPFADPPNVPDAEHTPTITTITYTDPYLEIYSTAIEQLPTLPTYNITVTRRDAAVPEPATWALMLTGFGAVGAMLRRRHSQPAISR